MSGRFRSDLGIDTIIDGKYRLGPVLGEGGMGIVYAATRLLIDTPVAIKFLKHELANDLDALRRFVREARAAAMLRSEHVCKVIDVSGLDDGTPYIVMERLHGEDLATLIEAGPVSVDEACGYLIEVCEGLHEAHDAGLVHRDLKPSNLFLARRADGGAHVKILDFGIAKIMTDPSLTQTTSNFGSPSYMSPEQLRSSKHVDRRSDVWSLGTILFELVVGTRPFDGGSPTEVALKVTLDPPPEMTGASAVLQPIVHRCLEKEPEDRYADVAALTSDLRNVLARVPVVERRTEPSHQDLSTLELATTLQHARREPSGTGRQRIGIIAMIAMIVVLAGFTTWLVASSGSSEVAPDAARLAAPPRDADAPSDSSSPAVSPVVTPVDGGVADAPADDHVDDHLDAGVRTHVDAGARPVHKPSPKPDDDEIGRRRH